MKTNKEQGSGWKRAGQGANCLALKGLKETREAVAVQHETGCSALRLMSGGQGRIRHKYDIQLAVIE
ncbi:hypothetical protein [Alcaligenes nematophilus]|uniref:hypothetical protein n=1 Tax=Alcaligenes nematophilus TaxID=2994643 RepID=UPI00384AAE7D